MKDYTVRVLLHIALGDREYYYSDVEGIAHKYTTSSDGNVIVEDDIILYKQTILNSGEIKESFDFKSVSASVSNVSIDLLNIDNLHLNNDIVALESGIATLLFVRGNFYDEVLGKLTGKIDGVGWDRTYISFTIISQEDTLFYNIPSIVLDDKTFQTKMVLFDAEFHSTNVMNMRFNIWGTTNERKYYVKRILHSSFKGHGDDYWKGARIDVIDAEGELANPEGEYFAIGEFAIAIASKDNMYASKPGVLLNTSLDRYFLYRDIDSDVIDNGNAATTPEQPYEMRDIINNTMCNTVKGSHIEIEDPNFDGSTSWKTSTGFTMSGGYAVKTAGNSGEIYQSSSNQGFSEDSKYLVKFSIVDFTAGSGNDFYACIGDGAYPPSADHRGPLITTDGIHKQYIKAGSSTTGIRFYADTTITAKIDWVTVEPINKPKLLVTRKPIPENSDSIGRPFPIVYGHIEKMLALHSISSKSTRQNSFSAGDDVYVIASHRIMNKSATETLVYYGLEENAESMRLPPGTIDYVPVPLPRSISEIDRWHDSGYDLASGDPYKDVCPLHKLIEISTNYGDVLTAIKLRGDEYTGFLYNNTLPHTTELDDGDLPSVNGQPQFPIRYGLGNSKVYVSFDGYEDITGEYTGAAHTLIEHPIDILKHFLLNYTNIKDDKTLLDYQSFAVSKSKLPNWKFGVAITETLNGKDFVERILKQCHTVWKWENQKFSIYTIDLEDRNPTVFLNEQSHFVGEPKWSRPSIKDIYNDYIIRYGYDGITKSYTNVIQKNTRNDQLCRNSYSRYGVVRSFEEMFLPDIYNSYTAERVAMHSVLTHTPTRLTLQVGLHIDEQVSMLAIGSVVQVTYFNEDGDEESKIFVAVNLTKGSTKYTVIFVELV